MNTTYAAHTQQASIDIALGPERYVYERILFGSASTNGITQGDFYDMRGYPVPYTTSSPTDMTLKLPEGSELIGANLVIEIIRETPENIPPKESTKFSPSAAITNFSVQLGHGLNFIKVITESGDVVASYSISATKIATVLYAIAVDIYAQIWEPIDATAKEIFDTNTGMFASLLSFEDLLPMSSGRRLLATYLSVRALVPKAGTDEGLTDLIQALFDQSPLRRKATASGWEADWLRPDPATPLLQYGQELHIWPYDQVSSRIVQFGRLCKNFGGDVKQNQFGADVNGVEYDWGDTLTRKLRSESTQIARKAYAGHVIEIQTELNMHFPLVEGRRLQVQSPGLWDGRVPYFDQGRTFDSGNGFNTDDTDGPLGYKGWVGVPILPPAPLTEAVSEARPSMSVLISTSNTAEMQNNLAFGDLTLVTEYTWGQTADESNLTFSTWVPPPSATVVLNAAIDVLYAVTLSLLGVNGTGHSHKVRMLTVGEWKSLLSGDTITITSGFDAEESHTHDLFLELSFFNSTPIPQVTISNNHGHLIAAEIPQGFGL